MPWNGTSRVPSTTGRLQRPAFPICRPQSWIHKRIFHFVLRNSLILKLVWFGGDNLVNIGRVYKIDVVQHTTPSQQGLLPAAARRRADPGGKLVAPLSVQRRRLGLPPTMLDNDVAMLRMHPAWPGWGFPVCSCLCCTVFICSASVTSGDYMLLTHSKHQQWLVCSDSIKLSGV